MLSAPLSVVVPTRDRPDHLRRCLAALRASLRAGDELIVVDSASVDPEVGAVARSFEATLVRCERPGASRARNAGARAASHDLLAFVDDDVEVTPGWATRMAEALTADGVSFVCGRVGLPPGDAGGLRQIAVKDDPEPAVLDLDTPAPLGCSANLGLPGSVLVAVGGFDEALGGGGRFHAAEDVDLFDRLLAAGFVGRYEPGAMAWHEQWRTRGQLLRLDWGYGVGLGARLVKLLRSDRRRMARVLREAMWTDGLRVLATGVRHRYEFLVLTTASRLAGTVAGVVAAVVVPVRDGHFVATGDEPGDDTVTR